MRTDKELKERVVTALEADPSLDVARVGVAVADQVVTLTGAVPSHAARLALVERAQGVAEGCRVSNQVEVQIPSTHRRPDPEIADAVERILGWNVLLPPESVRIRVTDGWVELEGAVDWDYQRAAAEAALAPLIGIRGLSNLIAVRPQTRADEIRGRIEAALRHRADLAVRDSQDLQVETHGDVVILRGRVHSWADRALVEAAAWGAPGVTAVTDELEVIGKEQAPEG